MSGDGGFWSVVVLVAGVTSYVAGVRLLLLARRERRKAEGLYRVARRLYDQLENGNTSL